MKNFMLRLNRNRVFKFLSSVRLAVPVMLVLGVVVAVGTVIESRYNAQIATILVYRASWFLGLLGLLWLNIFCATLSRWPFKKHHTGFVITHIGLLTLLIGSVMTGFIGLDGSLRVVEGRTSNQVVLNGLSVQVAQDGSAPFVSRFTRSLKPTDGAGLGISIPANLGFTVEKYLPFAARSMGFAPVKDPAQSAGAGLAVTFKIQSQFFNVSESLHEKARPELSMGPARLRIVSAKTAAAVARPVSMAKGKAPAKAQAKAQAKTGAKSSSGAASLVVVSERGEAVGRVSLAVLKSSGWTYQGKTIRLNQAFEDAVVAGGKLTDRGTPGANPALDIAVEAGGKKAREILFAKHPEFAMNPKGALGLHFRYEAGEVPVTASAEESGMPAGHPPIGDSANEGGAMASTDRSGNVVEFSLADAGQLNVNLYKNGTQVFSQKLSKGQEVTTPWMGMRLTLLAVQENVIPVDDTQPAALLERQPMPPSAVFIRPVGASVEEGAWLMEGEVKELRSPSGSREIYYGPDTVDLPFAIQLEKFTKTDYPGTETPMSYQSQVKVDAKGDSQVISMNEPMKHDGFTLYQSSFEMGQGMETASIFSVNRDPGRPVKYAGSMILCLGILVFTLMRSRWYRTRSQSKAGAQATALGMLLFALTFAFTQGPHGAMGVAYAEDTVAQAPQAAQTSLALTPEVAKERFIAMASKIDSSAIAGLPVQSHGRVKPLDSFARETILYLTGKYSMWGLDAVQLYLGIMISDASPFAELINLRDPDLRKQLELGSKTRWFSSDRLITSRLEAMARPALDKQEKTPKLLNSIEKAEVEAMQQLWLFRGIVSGEQLFSVIHLNPTPGAMSGHGADQRDEQQAGMAVESAVQNYLRALARGDLANSGVLAKDAVALARTQSMPDLFKRYIKTLDVEVLYNQMRIFFWVAMIYLLLGGFLISGFAKNWGTKKVIMAVLAWPFLAHIGGFAVRVWITGFAPVTNMYGTMVWMSFGVVLFGGALFAIYSHRVVYGLLLIGSGLTLLLTESIPLVLSPDLDPIVAVLRSNFWLTIHVLTISISYAAFTIAMLIGNVVLVRSFFTAITGRAALPASELTQYSHLVYRVIQLGVFLLTAGIILGGIWADYSWGRFWGWDPKETWALIADLGFLAILHARYLGWLGAFGVLAASPAAYLLVVMAWYGVNFVLAAGLHSYGFSSGGAMAVAIFVTFQILLFAVGAGLRQLGKSKSS